MGTVRLEVILAAETETMTDLNSSYFCSEADAARSGCGRRAPPLQRLHRPSLVKSCEAQAPFLATGQNDSILFCLPNEVNRHHAPVYGPLRRRALQH